MQLPVDALLPTLRAALRAGPNAVLTAQPGAGKTTRVPPALLDEPWLAGKRLLMLEPRRLAARAAARYMAAQRGEQVGATIGFRVRGESRVSAATRIEVVTEGILTRLLQDDAALEAYGGVILDEFHERSLHADLGLALLLDSQAGLRPDLRILVMSATIDAAAVARLLGDAPVLDSPGRAFPVATRFTPVMPDTRFDRAVAGTVMRALREEPGSVLVFLPGAGEIRRVAELVAPQLDAATRLVPLYGELASGDQDAAIAPAAPGTRKVVLATSIAETSLTIEGVRVVVDAGQMRRPRFDPVSGMTRLDTLRVSRASADQRRGRAGRLEPGVCYRMWSEGEDARLTPFTPPEIADADLAPLVLTLAVWGAAAESLRWLDAPRAAPVAQARELLLRLGALDGDGRITAHGRALERLPLHPRLAHMVVRGAELGHAALACELAALLEERDIVRARPGEADADLRARVAAVRDRGDARWRLSAGDLDSNRLRAVRDATRDLKRAQRAETGVDDIEATGEIVALAYPERVAQRRSGDAGRYLMVNGKGARFGHADGLAREAFLAVAHLDGDSNEARVFLAAPLSRAELEQAFQTDIRVATECHWDDTQGLVVARQVRRLGALVLEEGRAGDLAPERIVTALLDGIRMRGLGVLPWTEGLRTWQARVLLLRRALGETWPAVDDASLLASLEDWLAPYLAGRSRLGHLADLPLREALESALDHQQRRKLDELAPLTVEVPSGSRVAIDYTVDPPVLAVKLQEMFGATDTPRIAGGKVALVLHLLSPARRPVQVTQDLAGFWRSSYHEVRKDLRGRYPRHPWPEDPLSAAPTKRAKPRGT
jgi:ATP-dependent helicase HrpB